MPKKFKVVFDIKKDGKYILIKGEFTCQKKAREYIDDTFDFYKNNANGKIIGVHHNLSPDDYMFHVEH